MHDEKKALVYHITVRNIVCSNEASVESKQKKGIGEDDPNPQPAQNPDADSDPDINPDPFSAIEATSTGDEPQTTKIRKTSNLSSVREQWANAFDFLLACIGFSVGLGNVWRFPYLCYKNGGGAFLIPYFLFVLIGGIPMFYLEVAVGQYMAKGGLQAWNIVPLFQGIGVTSCIIVFYLNIYYNVILAWAYYYFFNSFTSELPWRTCGNDWNTDYCSQNFSQSVVEKNITDATLLVDPVTEYWERKVLAISEGIHDMGEIKWDLCLCLLFGWIVVYCCIWKGIKSSGKVMYITATSPYIFMTVLLVKNSTLEGASDGVMYYLTPDVNRLADPQVWVDAGTQIFFSSSIALGTLTALGSYNKFNQNSYRDSFVFAGVNSGTSFFSGFLVFTIMGHMAKVQNKSIADLAAKGPGLAFITYPTAVLQLPWAPMWSALFFLMIILLGLDSMFVGVEGVVTTFVDQYPRILHLGHRKQYFIGIACIIMFLLGLPMVTNGGMYVFQLFDFYSGSRIILLVALFELIAIAHVYGVRRFADNVRMMVGDCKISRTLPYMIVCWTFLSPLFCISVFILNAINYTDLTYSRPSNRTYVYPGWAIAIGWTLAASSAIWVPILGIWKWVQNGATKEVFKLLCVPYYLHPWQKRPEDQDEQCLYEYECRRKGLPLIELGFKKKKPMGLKTSSWSIGYTGYAPDEWSSSLSSTTEDGGGLSFSRHSTPASQRKSEKGTPASVRKNVKKKTNGVVSREDSQLAIGSPTTQEKTQKKKVKKKISVHF